MVVQPEHIQWLVDTGQRLQTVDGRSVEVWEFCHQPDDRILSAWAEALPQSLLSRLSNRPVETRDWIIP